MKETTVKINKTKSWFFEKINKIDKTLARLIRKEEPQSQQKERNHKNQNRFEKGMKNTIAKISKTKSWFLRR